jgi:hypothetical protein
VRDRARAAKSQRAERRRDAKVRAALRTPKQERLARATGGRHHAGIRRQASDNGKSRAAARPSRAVRHAMAAPAERNRDAARRPRARGQMLALAKPVPRRSGYVDPLDRAYSPPDSPPSYSAPRRPRERPTPLANIDPEWQAEIERGISKLECTRSSGAFGAPRRIPTDC